MEVIKNLDVPESCFFDEYSRDEMDFNNESRSHESRSEVVANIYHKMNKIRIELAEFNIVKGNYNEYSKYYYMELSDFLPELLRLCDKYGVFTQISFSNEVATLIITNCDAPAEQIIFNSPMRDIVLKATNAMQSLGGVETYQRRYLYMTAFEIVAKDVLDSTATSVKEAKMKPVEITPKQIQALFGLAHSKGYDGESVKKVVYKHYSKGIRELSLVEYDYLIEQYNKLSPNL
ncbi:hypothetical protein AN641_03630 [Candidatus Epulonipiscioides gigas]|uniref:Uncharacterized protein n=1 Tax=Candidatus Epulonipiscium fishelsonii TaxID=77094 RepID=A0ACC8XFL2_9FIRM|nr:hypothetical protein AN396_02240 [Epulopiscium sp. SCG-B11WGA-EpuloA1]ONI45681.1 hypothetical protein AN641_03630 [Epulopiscium sp. SCG-C07WGA-EpuloA2]ONI48319.1 hypothetical protein AN643_02065 [Epulopiscium sp. SCG-B10WGA-EpuloB]